MDKEFDLTIIGGGPGGYVAAIRALQLGLKVAVVEEREIGGTCLNRGCIPTKALLYSAEVFHIVQDCLEFGIETEGVRFDYHKISQRKESIVKQLRSSVEYLVKSNGGLIIQGKAFIKDKNSIEVTGKEKQTVKTDKLIIATGSRPFKPPIPGIDGHKVLDSDQVLGLTDCPEEVVIIGGGVIGVEFATIFNTLGKKVTIIEMMEAIIPGVDTEISMILRKLLESKGVKIFSGAKVTNIISDKSMICVFEKEGKTQRVEGDMIIAAIGRRPNTENLGLENIGVVIEKGFIKVDERMETAVKGVYAIGDVTGKVMLAHVASAQGLIAAANAAGNNQVIDYSVAPSCIYTNPEIATVGITEADAIKKKVKIKVGRFPVGANGKSMIMGEKVGLVKMVADAGTGKILGVHMMGPRATDIIAEACVAMKLESNIEDLSATIHPHPTVGEMIIEVSHDTEGICIHKKPAIKSHNEPLDLNSGLSPE